MRRAIPPDISKQLRDWDNAVGQMYPLVIPAADEIDRLRDVVEKLQRALVEEIAKQHRPQFAHGFGDPL